MTIRIAFMILMWYALGPWVYYEATELGTSPYDTGVYRGLPMIFYLVCECGWESEPKSDKCDQTVCPSCRGELGTRTVTDEEIAEKEKKLAERGFFLRPSPDILYGGEKGFAIVSESSARKLIFGPPIEWAIEMAYLEVFVHDAYGLGPDKQ